MKSLMAVTCVVFFGGVAQLNAQPSPLSEAGLCPFPGGRPARVLEGNYYPPHIPRGTDLIRVELQTPEAVCNDGTKAVVYVRGAVNGTRDGLFQFVDNKWIVHFQEGGICASYDGCIERWCGTAFYDASKMSSRWAPSTMGGTGIFLRDPRNQFSNYNQVYAYYCSSDGWLGRKAESVINSSSSEKPPYSVHFRGAQIVDAIFTELRGGNNFRGIMPNIDQATHIYLTGSSAGTIGLRQHLDRIAAMLKNRNANVVVAGITDAVFSPSEAGLFGFPVGDPRDPYTIERQTFYNEAVVKLWSGALDQSCVERNTGQPWRCTDNAFVETNHITTPVFARMDLQDSNVINDRNLTAFPTAASFARATHDALTAFTRMPQTSPEVAQLTKDPGVYGPNCGIHTALDSTNTFYARQVRGSDGSPISMHETLWNWISGQGITQAITTKPAALPTTPAYDALCAGGASLNTLSSASYGTGEPIAPGSIAATFGTNLAPVLAAASLPLPKSLLGTEAGVRDSAGVSRVADLYAVSPTQVNFIVPEASALGSAIVAVRNGAEQVLLGTVEIVRVAPGLYTANARGTGVAAALYLRIAANGQRTQGIVYDASLAAVPLPLGPEGDQVYLQLYGTGFKAARAITATVGGLAVPVIGFAPSPEYPGLDQVNIGPLPRSLAGRGAVDIVITGDGRRSNAASVTIQ